MTGVGINGFGRMGRLVVRAMANHSELRLAHVNEIAGTVDTAAHLLAFDSVHGRFPGTVASEDGDRLRIDDQPVTFSQHEDPGLVPWAELGVDLVLECTGAFRSMAELTPYFEAGVRDVVVAAPVDDPAVLNVVMGCNQDRYDPSRHRVTTAASCTTNCIAPVIKVLHESIGIERGSVTTMHDVTNTQVVVDAPHKDLRRARSALNSLIPTTTGSAKAISLIYPELEGRLNGLAVRVPLLNASLADCVFHLREDVTSEQLNRLFADAAAGPLEGVLGYESLPLVSADFTNDTRSGIVDGPSTMVIDGSLAKVLVWYDNEFGYVHRMAELACLVGTDRD